MKYLANKRWIASFALMLIFTSCESYLINGDLDGFWQVQEIEWLETGDVVQCNNEAFYAFQRHIVQLTQYPSTHVMGQMSTRYHASFDWQGDSISMGDFREYDLDGSKKKTPLSELKKFGLCQEYTTFHILLSPKKLTLTSDSTRISLRKY